MIGAGERGGNIAYHRGNVRLLGEPSRRIHGGGWRRLTCDGLLEEIGGAGLCGEEGIVQSGTHLEKRLPHVRTMIDEVGGTYRKDWG